MFHRKTAKDEDEEEGGRSYDLANEFISWVCWQCKTKTESTKLGGEEALKDNPGIRVGVC